MDGLVFIIIALVFVFQDMKKGEVDLPNNQVETIEQEDITRVAKVNESYYDDPNAFSIIINNLGYPKERS